MGLNRCFALWHRIFFKASCGGACYLLGLPEMTDNFQAALPAHSKEQPQILALT